MWCMCGGVSVGRGKGWQAGEALTQRETIGESGEEGRQSVQGIGTMDLSHARIHVKSYMSVFQGLVYVFSLEVYYFQACLSGSYLV